MPKTKQIKAWAVVIGDWDWLNVLSRYADSHYPIFASKTGAVWYRNNYQKGLKVVPILITPVPIRRKK